MAAPRKAATRVEPRTLAAAYLSAKEHLLQSGYGAEIDWQSDRNLEGVTESEFLRQSAWVVLSCGFRESVVRRKFSGISTAFLNWDDSRRIQERIRDCQAAALRVFGHKRKIDAIAEIVCHVADESFVTVKEHLLEDGVVFIRRLPFMGPVTSLHLAKNLGLPCVKPDRHLVRTAEAAGYSSPDEMCRTIHDVVGDPPAVIDLVVWRFATITPNYVSHFNRSDIGSLGSCTATRRFQPKRQ